GRVLRVYPELEGRALAAGALLAADAISPTLGYETFQVGPPSPEPCLVSLADGSCSCSDVRAPIHRETKLCRHMIACPVYKRLAERAEDLLGFRPTRPRPQGRANGFAIFDDRVFRYDQAAVVDRSCVETVGRDGTPDEHPCENPDWYFDPSDLIDYASDAACV